MSMFKHLEGETVIMVESGVYKPTDLYTRAGALFAKSSGGFVRLYADGSSSKAKCRVDTLLMDGQLYRDRLGRLCTADHPDRVALAPESAQKLLGNG